MAAAGLRPCPLRYTGPDARIYGNMLGTRRSSVTVAAGILQKAGLISYERGMVKIVDRKKLEEAACVCYGLLQRQIKLWGEELEPE
ncbi:MAG: helix-turn-helix domain-containing protein [Terriglobales bacterium]